MAPSPIGVTRLGGNREQRLLHTPSLPLRWGDVEELRLPSARRLSEGFEGFKGLDEAATRSKQLICPVW